MVCDLDGFKQVNDRFGHLEGNRILRLFAKSLQGSCREYDYVARMGGDEFVIVAPGLSSSAAMARAACLNELAKSAGWEVCGENLLSLSVGCVIHPEDGLDAEKLLAEADRRMYLQKQEHYAERLNEPTAWCGNASLRGPRGVAPARNYAAGEHDRRGAYPGCAGIFL